MAINAKSTSNEPRELIPAGNYVARCYKMIELGTIQEEFKGVPKMQHKVWIEWELPNELKIFNPEKGEQPLSKGKEYTLSLADKSNLRRDLNSWRGKDFTPQEADNFDITKLLGVPCMLNIIHASGKTNPEKKYDNISSISPLPKGFECPKQINETFVFEFENYDQAKFESLPQFLKDKIITSNEYKIIHGGEVKENALPSAVDTYLGKETPLEDDEELAF
jgi:hypothetical protein